MDKKSSHQTVDWHDLGLMAYKPAWSLQKAIQQKIIDEKLKERKTPGLSRSNDLLLFAEHPHVYTLGKSGSQLHLLASDQELKNAKAEFVKIDRGGDITYHGPGQIVGYPILDLDRHFTDIHKYLRFLEEVIIRVCTDYGFEAERVESLTGVWVDGRKVCAMGIKCSRWVTLHGFALNVNTQLNYFNKIVPCGIADRGVTSLEELSGKKVDENEVKSRILEHFSDVFSVKLNKLDALQVHSNALQEIVSKNKYL